MSVQKDLFEKALKIFQEQDMEKAKEYIRENFGDDVDLNIVKCNECGEIIALVTNILAVGLMGGDKKVDLEILKHIRKHPTHANKICGYSHGEELPYGETLMYGTPTKLKEMPFYNIFKFFIDRLIPDYAQHGLVGTAEHHNITVEEVIDKRIKHLEAKLISTSILRE